MSVNKLAKRLSLLCCILIVIILPLVYTCGSSHFEREESKTHAKRLKNSEKELVQTIETMNGKISQDSIKIDLLYKSFKSENLVSKIKIITKHETIELNRISRLSNDSTLMFFSSWLDRKTETSNTSKAGSNSVGN